MEVIGILISPSLELGDRVEWLDDGYWHVKEEYKKTWTQKEQELLDECNDMLREYRNDRSKLIFDDDID